MKRFAAVLIASAAVSAAVLAGLHVKKSLAGRSADAERNGEAKAAESLRRRVDALEAENEALAGDLRYMTAKNGEAIGMAEELLVYTRLSYPMGRENIIEQLAGYQTALIALLCKLKEIK
jgi:cell division protein FtsB